MTTQAAHHDTPDPEDALPQVGVPTWRFIWGLTKF
jgi:hypothetical protein